MILRNNLVPEYLKYQLEIDDAISSVLKSGRYTLSEKVSTFESEFSAYNGVSYCLGVANGTDAIILALRACGIKDGDEVITTPYTAYATISAIISAGAVPIFVDVCEDSYLIDIEKVLLAIGPKTKAIVAVHLFGNIVDIERLRLLAGENIYIIEDAAQAHGSSMNNRKAGSIGDIGCFSFYPTKNLGGYGDGGAIITNNNDLYNKIKSMRMYGMRDKDHVQIHGMNSRLDEIQAAILSVKLKYLDKLNNQRNLIAKKYISGLNNELIKHQNILKNTFSNYHVFESRFMGDRDALIDFLEENNIQVNIYYLFPHHLQDSLSYLGYSVGDFPVSERLSTEVIALPLYPEIELTTVDHIISIINNYCKNLGNNKSEVINDRN